MCSGRGRCLPLRELVPLGAHNGLPLGGGSPPTQLLTCSMASGYLYLTLRHAQTAAIAYDASPAALALALENLGVLPGGVSVRLLPRLAGGLSLTPATICSGDPASPVRAQLSFPGLGGALPPLGVSVGEQSASDAGSPALTVLAPGSLPAYGQDPALPGAWDAGMLQACHCDGYPEWNASGLGSVDVGRWTGTACEQRLCPVGLLPLSPQGLAPAVQALACSSSVTGGSFSLSFRGQATPPLPFDASGSEVGAALRALASVGEVSLSVGDASSGLCGGGPSRQGNNTFTVTFLTELGQLPLLVVDGSSLQGEGLTVTSVALGSGTVLECSGHGVCDSASGLCNCLPGYASSGGVAGGLGGRGDCGVATTGM